MNYWKVLITTYCRFMDICSVHTVIAEYNSRPDAELAAKIINSSKLGDGVTGKHEALCLFQ